HQTHGHGVLPVSNESPGRIIPILACGSKARAGLPVCRAQGLSLADIPGRADRAIELERLFQLRVGSSRISFTRKLLSRLQPGVCLVGARADARVDVRGAR